jgi:putative transposase
MPRQARNTPGGLVYHVLNRANGRLRIFKKDADILAFEKTLTEAMRRCPTRLIGWCIMGNHWHFVVWPRRDGELSEFFRWLTHTHVQRWHAAHGTAGMGHVYQGRFKAFPVQDDEHVLRVLRYVHRNPVRAKLVKQAQDWRGSSLWIEANGTDEQRGLLCDGPVDRPRNWLATVNAAQPEEEEEMIAESIRRSRPLGEPRWIKQMVAKLGLEWTVRPRGRPKKELRPL